MLPNVIPANPMNEELRGKAADSWTKEEDFVCRGCGAPAHKEPAGEDGPSPRRWGCLTCNYITFNPGTSFTDAVPP